MSSEKTTVLTRDTISRLLRDVRNIMKNPLTENGIYYTHDDEDILKGYALIIGPSETPYFGGNYLRFNIQQITHIVLLMLFIAPMAIIFGLIQISINAARFASPF